jgi:hypothetical protein
VPENAPGCGNAKNRQVVIPFSMMILTAAHRVMGRFFFVIHPSFG